ncbi:hypothetical protein TWF706_002226 [Orbilia oligospora]|nr:hypothetical protein TWF706_002226 [Orbilia oligospora]
MLGRHESVCGFVYLLTREIRSNCRPLVAQTFGKNLVGKNLNSVDDLLEGQSRTKESRIFVQAGDYWTMEDRTQAFFSLFTILRAHTCSEPPVNRRKGNQTPNAGIPS